MEFQLLKTKSFKKMKNVIYDVVNFINILERIISKFKKILF